MNDELQKPPPDKLRLHADGSLTCADGTDVTKYLARYFATVEATEPLAVNITPRNNLQRLQCDAWMLRNMGA